MSKPYELRESDEAGDYRNYVVRTSDGRELGWDHGEPEDNTFTRDYDWVVPELNEAYARGLEEAAGIADRWSHWGANIADAIRARAEAVRKGSE